MRILLFGCNGQVGWELQQSLTPLGELFAYDKKIANFKNVDKLRKLIREVEPDIIVNAAAYTKVDKAEQEPEKAYQVNAKAVTVLAEESKRLQSLLVHYSADYVFDGKKENAYTEEDMPNPLNVYGKSKLEGEQMIQLSGCDYMIFRTSWVYETHGHNFVKTMMRLFHEKSEITVVSDQFGVPTSASLIANVTTLILYKLINEKKGAVNYSGIYNLVACGETSWYDFTHFILSQLMQKGVTGLIDSKNIIPILSKDYQASAKRPKNGRLSTKKLTQAFDLFLPHWKTDVERVINELIERA